MAGGNTGKTGTKKTLTAMTDIKFRVYKNYLKRKKKYEEIKDKWVYIFRIYSWGATIRAELYVDKNGKYALVDWSEKGKKQWQKDQRQATKELKGNLPLFFDLKNFRTYIFLSNVQLPYNRIQAYLKDPRKISARANLMDPESEIAAIAWGSDFERIEGTDGGYIYLIDHMKEAVDLQNKYSKALDRHYQFAGDEKKSQRNFLGNIALQVAQAYAKEDDDIWDWLKDKGRPLKKELQDYEDRSGRLRRAAHRWGEEKCKWMDDPGYREMREDYSGTEELRKIIEEHEATVLDRTYETNVGRKYLDKWVKDETSWINRYVREDVFQVTRRSTQLAAKILENWSVPTVRYVTQTKFIEEVTPILKRKLLVEPKLKMLPSGEMKWVAEDEWEFYKKKTAVDYEVAVVDTEKIKIQVPDAVLVALEVINLMLTLKALAESKSGYEITKRSIALVGAVADVVASLARILKNKVKAAVFKIAGILSSLFDYVMSIWALAEATW
ncbi:MAG: hypothetical protein JXB45_00060, partial [Candidatus Krumholzibacteriota bacterium]|nr:hypothetical protein [Candidatus Krumholzibacteriota bacterium]